MSEEGVNWKRSVFSLGEELKNKLFLIKSLFKSCFCLI